MPIDASIALQGKLPQIQTPNELMANAYTMQNAQQANQLNMMKMDEYKRGLTETSQIKNALTRLNPTSPTFEQDRYNAFALQGPEGLKTLSAIKKEEAATGETALKSKGQKVSNLDAVRKFSAQSYKEIINRPSEAIVTAFIEDAEENPDIPKEILADMKRRAQRILSVPAPIDPTTGKPDYSLRQQHIMQMNLEAKDLMGKTGQRDIGGSIQDTMTSPLSGEVTVTGTTPKTPTPGEQKPTFNQGAWYYPPTAENPQGTMAGEIRADKPKPLTMLQDTKLQHDIGKDYKTTQDAIASFADVKKATAQVKSYTNDQLGKVTGKYGEYLPSFGETAKNVDTDLANLKGKVTSLGKIAASASGAIGSMAVQEWTLVRDMIAALDETKMTPQKLRQQMDLIDAQLAGAETRLRDEYAKTHQEDFVRYPKRFELPQSTNAPAAAKPNAPARNPMKAQAYEAYLKAHSGDNK
jgi:hypothetical protein